MAVGTRVVKQCVLGPSGSSMGLYAVPCAQFDFRHAASVLGALRRTQHQSPTLNALSQAKTPTPSTAKRRTSTQYPGVAQELQEHAALSPEPSWLATKAPQRAVQRRP